MGARRRMYVGRCCVEVPPGEHGNEIATVRRTSGPSWVRQGFGPARPESVTTLDAAAFFSEPRTGDLLERRSPRRHPL